MERVKGSSETTYPPEWKDLTEQQISILVFLEEKEPQKSIRIAKHLKKITAKEVNPDLYALQRMNLLSHDKEKNLWTMKQKDNGENVTNTVNIQSRELYISEKPAYGNLTENQKNICTFLHENGPHEALHIAKGLNKVSKKQINPDLYYLKNINILDQDGKCWCLTEGNRGNAARALSSKRYSCPPAPAITYNQITIHAPYVQIGDNNAMNVGEFNSSSDLGNQNASNNEQTNNQNEKTITTNISIINSKMENCIFGDRNTMKIGNKDSDIGFDAEGEAPFHQNQFDQEVEQATNPTSYQSQIGNNSNNISRKWDVEHASETCKINEVPTTLLDARGVDSVAINCAASCKGSNHPLDSISFTDSVITNSSDGIDNTMSLQEYDSGIGLNTEKDPTVTIDQKGEDCEQLRDYFWKLNIGEDPACSETIQENQSQRYQTSSPSSSQRHLPWLDISAICADIEKVSSDEQANSENQ